MLKELLKRKNMSMYQLSKITNIPYSTINDICLNKTKIQKCNVETVFRLSKALGISMEELVKDACEPRVSFESFKSSICHRVKAEGDIPFIIHYLKSDDIHTYYNQGWYIESFYLLAMVDYLSRENGIPLCKEFDELRKKKLDKPVYPASLFTVYLVTKNKKVLKEAEEKAIKEFKNFNIIENEVRNVI